MKKPLNPCCEPFSKAFESGTDGEGWLPLLDAEYAETPGTVEAGSGLPPINFCPWCGSSAKDWVIFDDDD